MLKRVFEALRRVRLRVLWRLMSLIPEDRTLQENDMNDDIPPYLDCIREDDAKRYKVMLFFVPLEKKQAIKLVIADEQDSPQIALLIPLNLKAITFFGSIIDTIELLIRSRMERL